jgi:hypothetical protein
MYKCKYFKVQELVSPQVYQRYGEFCWKFFSDLIKIDLDTIRNYHGHQITINDWVFGGKNYTQCGYRSNLEPMVKAKKTLYCSAHCMAKAFDLHSLYSNYKLYKDIEYLKTNGMLKAVRRIESRQSTKDGWVHIDEFDTDFINKLEVFTA